MRTTPQYSVIRSRNARCSGRANSSPRRPSNSAISSRATSSERSGAGLRDERRRPTRRLATGDPAEDEALGERVPAQSVGAVDSGRTLADRVEPLDVGRMRLRFDENAAHRVVGGRCHLHRLLRDVDHREVDELPVHPRQPRKNRRAVEVGDVEQDAAVLGATPCHDLRVVRERDAVAARELEPLGVVALHEPLAGRVSEHAALTAHGLGDERARGLLGMHHAGWVELHELHVLEPAARLGREPHRIACVLVAAGRRATPDSGVAAGCQHDGVGRDEAPSPSSTPKP